MREMHQSNAMMHEKFSHRRHMPTFVQWIQSGTTSSSDGPAKMCRVGNAVRAFAVFCRFLA